MLMLGALLPGFGDPDAEGVLPRVSGFLGGPAIIAIAAVAYKLATDRLGGNPARVHEPARPAPIGVALLVTLVGIAAALVGSYGLGVVMELLDFPVVEQPGILEITEAAKRGEATLEVVVLAGSAVVLAPLAEEWMFRGLLFRRLRQFAGRHYAFALSALAFAAIHTNLQGFVVYAWLGLVFALVLERTGRLWTAIAVHAGNNAFALSLLLFGQSPPT